MSNLSNRLRIGWIHTDSLICARVALTPNSSSERGTSNRYWIQPAMKTPSHWI